MTSLNELETKIDGMLDNHLATLQKTVDSLQKAVGYLQGTCSYLTGRLDTLSKLAFITLAAILSLIVVVLA